METSREILLSSTKITFDKAWVDGKNNLVFQVLIPQKIVLVLRSQWAKEIFYLQKKGQQELKQNPMTEICRKYLSGGFLHEVASGKNKNEFLFYWQVHEKKYVLQLRLESGFQFNLISLSEKESLCRFESNGCFTKKKTCEMLPEIKEEINKIPLIENENSQAKVSFDKNFYLAKLKRKIKTLKKSSAGKIDIEETEKKIETLKKEVSSVMPNDSRSEESSVMPNDSRSEECQGILKNIGIFLNKKYAELKKLKTQLEIEKKLEHDFKKQLEEIEKLKIELESQKEINSLDIATRFKKLDIQIEKKEFPSSKPKPSLPCRVFIACDEKEIWVGKSATDNDQLLKISKGNDYWLHAVNVSGSHVIIPISQRKNREVEKKVLEEAAILAVYYSKISKDYRGEVYVTKRQWVKKKKGMVPGMVHVERGETMQVKFDENKVKEITERSFNV